MSNAALLLLTALLGPGMVAYFPTLVARRGVTQLR